MKKYIVTVNGKKYEVEVEEALSSSETLREAPVVKEVTKEETVKEFVKPTSGNQVIKAPMPGTILNVKINEGQTVKRGDVLFILEAMKMENEIMAGEDGKVTKVAVTKGTQVNTDDILAVLE